MNSWPSGPPKNRVNRTRPGLALSLAVNPPLDGPEERYDGSRG